MLLASSKIYSSITSPVDPGFTTDLAGTLISRLLTYAIGLAGMYFLVRLVMGGFTFLTSFGEPGKISSAQQTIVNAFVGLVVVVAAYFIAQLVTALTGVRILFGP